MKFKKICINIYHYGTEEFNLKFTHQNFLKERDMESKIFMNCENNLLGFIIYTATSTDYGTGNTFNLLKDFNSY